jgi:hypothetical protein
MHRGVGISLGEGSPIVDQARATMCGLRNEGGEKEASETLTDGMATVGGNFHGHPDAKHSKRSFPSSLRMLSEIADGTVV